jgi:hypothetical protein
MYHSYDPFEMTDKILTVIDDGTINRVISINREFHKDCLPDEIAKDICDCIIDANPNRVRYRKYKVYCQHCGAPIQPNEPHCPYCSQPYIEFKE